MLARILDTSGIDMDDPKVRAELETDLRRMDRLRHPEDNDAYRVKVSPSTETWSAELHRFRFEIQYGSLVGGEFKPKGETVRHQTESLPMI